jgi:hypothetical protein
MKPPFLDLNMEKWYLVRNSPMKRFLPIILILSFFGMAAFGVPMLDMEPGHSGGCVASAVDGKPCPLAIADFAKHHFYALQGFMVTAAVPNQAPLLLLAVLLLFSAGLFLVFRQLLLFDVRLPVERVRNLELDSLQGRRALISWLSLFEHSPTAR